jgi:hypothetical protein
MSWLCLNDFKCNGFGPGNPVLGLRANSAPDILPAFRLSAMQQYYALAQRFGMTEKLLFLTPRCIARVVSVL